MKSLTTISDDLSRAARGAALRDTTLAAAIKINQRGSSSPGEKIAADLMTHAYDLIQRYKVDQKEGRRSSDSLPIHSYPIMRLEIVIQNALHALGLSS